MSTETTQRGRARLAAGGITRSTPPQALIDLINPVIRWLLRSPLHGLLDRSMLVLHVVGRQSGRVYDIPVGFVRLREDLIVTTQHRWHMNLRRVSHVDVTLGGVRRPVDVTTVEQPERVAAILADIIGTVGWRDARRRLGLSNVSDTPPTIMQLTKAAAAYRLTVVELAASAGAPAL